LGSGIQRGNHGQKEEDPLGRVAKMRIEPYQDCQEDDEDDRRGSRPAAIILIRVCRLWVCQLALFQEGVDAFLHDCPCIDTRIEEGNSNRSQDQPPEISALSFVGWMRKELNQLREK